jgi:hypothetical protein
VLRGCKFVVPANAGAGNNDLFADNNVTFACPPGTEGKAVTFTNKSGKYHLLATQLPPSTEIVHCAPAKPTPKPVPPTPKKPSPAPAKPTPKPVSPTPKPALYKCISSKCVEHADGLDKSTCEQLCG